MTVFFHNKEPIDLNAIMLMGVSVKSEGAIGYFGTGLKFALATLLRTGHKVHLHVSGQCIKFSTVPTDIRGETFDVIHMNGNALGFTTKLGRDWEVWHAYRELSSNCTDEAGVIGTSIPDGEWGTAFAIEGESIEAAHRNRGQIFIERTPDFATLSVEFHAKEALHGYYRGVRALDLPVPSIFTYNILSQTTLTEDRTIKHMHSFMSSIGLACLDLQDEQMIERLLLSPEGTLENRLDLDWESKPSPEFMRVCERLRQNSRCNQSALRTWTRYSGRDDKYTLVEMDAYEFQMFQSAQRLLKRLGCDISVDDFGVAESLGTDTYGIAFAGRILISKKTFDLGCRFLASTLYEEWLHRQHQYQDESRALQNFLFERLFATVERLDSMLSVRSPQGEA